MAKSRPVIDQKAIDRLPIDRLHIEGQGTHVNYKPWLMIWNVPSQELVTRDKRWETGRVHPLLSSLEREALFVFE